MSGILESFPMHKIYFFLKERNLVINQQYVTISGDQGHKQQGKDTNDWKEQLQTLNQSRKTPNETPPTL